MLRKIPTKIDGAIVLYWGETKEALGYGWYIDEHVENAAPEKRIIKYLVISVYDQYPLNGYYIFACDEDFNCMDDMLCSSIEEAFEEAKKYYKVTSIDWHQVNSN